MQRLFSSFADGWPGAGLLLLRLLAGGGLLYGGIASARSAFDTAQMVPPVLAAVFGAMLVVGLFTPFAGIMAAAVEVWIAFLPPGISLAADWARRSVPQPGHDRTRRLVHRCTPLWPEADRSVGTLEVIRSPHESGKQLFTIELSASALIWGSPNTESNR